MVRTVRPQLSRPTTTSRCVAPAINRTGPGGSEPAGAAATAIVNSALIAVSGRQQHRRRRRWEIDGVARTLEDVRSPAHGTEVAAVNGDGRTPGEDDSQPFVSGTELDRFSRLRRNQIERDVLGLFAGTDQRREVDRAYPRAGSGIITSRTKAFKSPHAAQNWRSVFRVAPKVSNSSTLSPCSV